MLKIIKIIPFQLSIKWKKTLSNTVNKQTKKEQYKFSIRKVFVNVLGTYVNDDQFAFRILPHNCKQLSIRKGVYLHKYTN